MCCLLLSNDSTWVLAAFIWSAAYQRFVGFARQSPRRSYPIHSDIRESILACHENGTNIIGVFKRFEGCYTNVANRCHAFRWWPVPSWSTCLLWYTYCLIPYNYVDPMVSICPVLVVLLLPLFLASNMVVVVSRPMRYTDWYRFFVYLLCHPNVLRQAPATRQSFGSRMWKVSRKRVCLRRGAPWREIQVCCWFFQISKSDVHDRPSRFAEHS